MNLTAWTLIVCMMNTVLLMMAMHHLYARGIVGRVAYWSAWTGSLVLLSIEGWVLGIVWEVL